LTTLGIFFFKGVDMEEILENSITSDEAFDEYWNAVGRLATLGERVAQIGQAIESGKKINPQTLKRLGGSIKWWNRRCWLWAIAYNQLSRERLLGLDKKICKAIELEKIEAREI
jgi:hypothetical protein